MPKLFRAISSMLLAVALVFGLLKPVGFVLAAASYYTNVNGVKVQAPVRTLRAPIGASARCKDGTYSFSKNRRGTCSGHRGVAQWL